jgi:deazaflavin-dependent oxidoreductase (nitroreductase family)
MPGCPSVGGMPNATDFGFKFFTGIHRAVFDVTNSRLGGRMGGLPIVKLTTTGRKTGKRRHTMLMAPIHDNDRVILVASKGGAPRHPAWYLNLRDHPQVTISMAGKSRAMVARTAAAAEKAELWPAIVHASKGYAGYQDKTDRDIPVVILEPTS